MVAMPLTKFFFSSSLRESQNTQVENEISVTCLFPDATKPLPSNGGFKNQESFANS